MRFYALFRGKPCTVYENNCQGTNPQITEDRKFRLKTFFVSFPP